MKKQHMIIIALHDAAQLLREQPEHESFSEKEAEQYFEIMREIADSLQKRALKLEIKNNKMCVSEGGENVLVDWTRYAK